MMILVVLNFVLNYVKKLFKFYIIYIYYTVAYCILPSPGFFIPTDGAK